MALIFCSECGKQMSDKAPKCPHCGAAQTTVQPAQPVYSAQPVRPSPAYGGEQFENVIVKGKKSTAGRIVCFILTGLLCIACAAVLGCVIYDYSFAASAGGFNYYGDRVTYYSSIAGGWFIEQYWLIIGLAAAAVMAFIGAAISIVGLGKRIKVTNARVIIKRPFMPTAGPTWDQIGSAAKETDTSFVVKSGEKKYRFINLKNQEEVLGVITDMLSQKNSGALKMPAVYGVKSVIGKLLRKKAMVITAAGAVVVAVAAAVLTPVIMGPAVQQVENVPYEWNVKELHYGSLNGGVRVIDVPIKGSYSGEWLNGRPCGTGTMRFDNIYPFVADSNTYTGTWKNGEPCEGTMSYEYSENTYEKYIGGFKYGRPHGQGKYNSRFSVDEGDFRYGTLFNGMKTHNNGTVEFYKNGKCVD